MSEEVADHLEGGVRGPIGAIGVALPGFLGHQPHSRQTPENGDHLVQWEVIAICVQCVDKRSDLRRADWVHHLAEGAEKNGKLLVGQRRERVLNMTYTKQADETTLDEQRNQLGGRRLRGRVTQARKTPDSIHNVARTQLLFHNRILLSLTFF